MYRADIEGISQHAHQPRRALHPDVFIVEIDAAFESPDEPPMSLVQIYRLRDGLIAHVRDYFVL